MLGMPLPFYKSSTLLLGFGLSPYVFWRLWKIRPDVIHVAFPGAIAEVCLECKRFSKLLFCIVGQLVEEPARVIRITRDRVRLQRSS